MNYIRHETEEVLPDEIRYLRPLTPHTDPVDDHDIPPWTTPHHPDYSWDPRSKPTPPPPGNHGDQDGLVA